MCRYTARGEERQMTNTTSVYVVINGSKIAAVLTDRDVAVEFCNTVARRSREIGISRTITCRVETWPLRLNHLLPDTPPHPAARSRLRDLFRRRTNNIGPNGIPADLDVTPVADPHSPAARHPDFPGSHGYAVAVSSAPAVRFARASCRRS